MCSFPFEINDDLVKELLGRPAVLIEVTETLYDGFVFEELGHGNIFPPVPEDVRDGPCHEEALFDRTERASAFYPSFGAGAHSAGRRS